MNKRIVTESESSAKNGWIRRSARPHVSDISLPDATTRMC